MKRALHSLILTASLLAARAENAPRLIGLEAQEATQALADEVRRGNFQSTIERMYPRWKGRLAGRAGGIEKLEKQLKEVTAQIKGGGVTIQSFDAAEPTIVRGVWPTKQSINGTEVMAPSQWLALVPTSTIYRVAAEGKVNRVLSEGFQVAIRSIDSPEWTFIDGGSLKVADLRALFPSLPRDLVLPKRGGKQL